MVNDNADQQTAENAAPAKERAKRERSAIEFPYSDLPGALELARTLRDRAGTSCDDEQLASWMNHSANGGTFRSRLSAARMFGLVETSQGKVTLTPLGHNALDDEKGRSARADAFLNVPLYSSLYEQFRGHVLPPAAAIERQIVAAGVSEKQKERARQTFTKSANYAGYIDQHSGRFIRPAVGSNGAAPHAVAPERPGTGGGGDPPYHPFIVGLLRTLPEPESEWSVVDRAKWLQTAASIFGLIYKGEGSIKVEASTKTEVAPA